MAAVGDAGALERQLEAQAARYRLDARAELAVAGQEGIGGGIGDEGTSFGPWMLHKGGAYPASAPQDPAAANRWAWSSTGVQYAESRMSSVAGGLHGDPAIEAIVLRFERPSDPQGEIQAAEAWYHGNGSLPAGAGLPPPSSGSSSGGTPGSFNPVSFLGAPVGTTEALAVRLAFAVAGVALLVLALVLLSKAASRRTVIAAAGGFLAGEEKGRRSSSSSEQPTVGPSELGTPPRLRTRVEHVRPSSSPARMRRRG